MSNFEFRHPNLKECGNVVVERKYGSNQKLNGPKDTVKHVEVKTTKHSFQRPVQNRVWITSSDIRKSANPKGAKSA